jgi:hypothetical protein
MNEVVEKKKISNHLRNFEYRRREVKKKIHEELLFGKIEIQYNL